jgi:hypothetical protein
MSRSSSLGPLVRLLVIASTTIALAACDRALTEPKPLTRTVLPAHRDLSDTLQCRGGWVIMSGIVYCG